MACDTPSSQDAFTHQIWNSYLKEYRRYAPDSMQFLETRSEVRFKVSDPIMVCDTSSSQDASTHQIWDSHLKQYKRYAPDSIILKTRSEVKVTVTQKWYATLRHPKMYPHTKFEIPTSKNTGDMDRTRKRDGLTDSAITICLPEFLWGHKNYNVFTAEMRFQRTCNLNVIW